MSDTVFDIIYLDGVPKPYLFTTSIFDSCFLSMKLSSDYCMIKLNKTIFIQLLPSSTVASNPWLILALTNYCFLILLMMETESDAITTCPLSLSYFPAGCWSPYTWLSRRLSHHIIKRRHVWFPSRSGNPVFRQMFTFSSPVPIPCIKWFKYGLFPRGFYISTPNLV